MVAHRPKRTVYRVKRYGFDDDADHASRNVDIDASDSGTGNEDSDESGNEDPFESESSDSDDNASASTSENSWTFVNSEEHERQPLQFTGMFGWQVDQPEHLSQYISTFLPDMLFEKLSSWTNSRARIAEAASYERGETDFTFKEVSVEEMKSFMGLTLAMGIIRKPSIDSYWSTEPLLRTAYFSDCMKRDRYREILRYLRFSDPYT